VAQLRRARGQRLRLVQRLRADFADVVDAHQRAGEAALVVGQNFASRGGVWCNTFNFR
jgi:hypothetical protein